MNEDRSGDADIRAQESLDRGENPGFEGDDGRTVRAYVALYDVLSTSAASLGAGFSARVMRRIVEQRIASHASESLLVALLVCLPTLVAGIVTINVVPAFGKVVQVDWVIKLWSQGLAGPLLFAVICGCGMLAFDLVLARRTRPNENFSAGYPR
ncbi:MAG: hypothetical protein KDI19_00135 [Pseudomonadales bacterium]|nr:hypothetical protein [Pseudomonadales bacterium]